MLAAFFPGPWKQKPRTFPNEQYKHEAGSLSTKATPAFLASPGKANTGRHSSHHFKASVSSGEMFGRQTKIFTRPKLGISPLWFLPCAVFRLFLLELLFQPPCPALTEHTSMLKAPWISELLGVVHSVDPPTNLSPLSKW